MYVDNILKSKGTDVAWVRPADGLVEATRRLKDRDIGALLVSEDGARPLGILSERDVARALAAYGEDLAGMVVRDLMTDLLITCSPEDTIDSLMAVITRHRVRHIPVLRDGRLVGVISIGDVVKQKLDEMAQETEALKEYIAGS